MSDLVKLEGFDRLNKVAELSLKGYSPSQIAKELDLPRAQVVRSINEWKDFLKNDKSIQERAQDALIEADEHYSMLISKAWEAVEESEATGDIRNKVASIKLVSDIQQKQMEMLQKAGVLDNAEMGARVAEAEEKQEILVGILKEVTSQCDHCRVEVASRLSRVTNKVEPVETVVLVDDV